jgi:hypothetical protein
MEDNLKIKGRCVMCGKECDISMHDPLRTTCSRKCAILMCGWESVEEYEKVYGNIL